MGAILTADDSQSFERESTTDFNGTATGDTGGQYNLSDCMVSKSFDTPLTAYR